MLVMILGLAIFLGVHSTRIVAEDWRNQMVSRLGENGWKAAYSVVSLAGFVLIIWGYGMARAAGSPVLYVPPVFLSHIAFLLMLIAFIALFAAYFGEKIHGVLKHPMLVAVKIWALAHLLSNGDLASLILFITFLAWAVADRISVKRRVATSSGQVVVGGIAGDAVAVVIGTGVYLAFMFWLHEAWIGVPVLPG